MGAANDIIGLIQSRQNVEEFQQLNWKGTFDQYLDLVIQNPRVTRTASQRVYDMILSHGVEEYSEH
jgi:serine protein kinase